MYKKVTALVLCAMLITGLAGCSTSTSKSGEKPEITWCMIKPIENMSSQEMVEEAANKIIGKEVDATLKFNLIEAGSWSEKMNLIISSGENFDICMTSSTGPTSIITNVKRGAFMDLTELIDKYGADIKAKTDPRAWDSVKFDGKIMAIPSQAKYVAETGYVFRKDLVEKYNFDYKSVKDLASMEPFLATLKEKEPNVIPLYITAGSNIGDPVNENYTDSMINGILFDEKEEKFVSTLSVKYNEYKIKNDYYKKGYIAKDAFTKQDASEGQSGKYAVLRDTGAYTEDGSKSSAFYGFPCVETLAGKGLIPPQNMMNGNAVSVTSKNPDKVLQLMNLVWRDPTLSNTMSYGVEGLNYSVVSGTTNDDKSVLPNTGSNQTWTIWNNWVGPLFDQWDSTWNRKPALMEMKANNETGKLSKTVGFLMDIDNLQAEVAALSEAVTASEQVLNVGNMDDFDSYINELKAKQTSAGIDKILSDINAQYTKWKSEK